MHDALKNEQFKVYLQPKVDLSTTKIVGAEALVRWQHPKKGLISPGVFIPIFEKNGFITELDMFVFTQFVKILNVGKMKISPHSYINKLIKSTS
ncbi:EAL domain-containing protein [Clostridioides difficile]|uniref:EAL domain-containing protein n=1 Tax=Clostridioides difficile TaxID=1496 RepID=UPI001F25C844|nr:EAL domain-containing protein [Clostridioides difficile]